LETVGALFTLGSGVVRPRQRPLVSPATTVAGDRTTSTVDRLVAETLGVALGDLDVDAPLTHLGIGSGSAPSLLARLQAKLAAARGLPELLACRPARGLERPVSGAGNGAGNGAAGPKSLGLLREDAAPACELVLFPGAGATALAMKGWASTEIAS